MQRYFPASRFVVFTTLNEAMNLRELVTFISFRGASRTSMPCSSGGGEEQKESESAGHVMGYYQHCVHADVGSAVHCP